MTYRTLQRQFQLDDDALHDLKDELLYAHPEVRDDAGRGLVWTGEAGPASSATAAPMESPDHSILKFFQVDITGMFRMTSCARYFKAGVGSSRPNWRWIMCFVERPKTNTSCKALVKRLSLS